MSLSTINFEYKNNYICCSIIVISVLLVIFVTEILLSVYGPLFIPYTIKKNGVYRYVKNIETVKYNSDSGELVYISVNKEGYRDQNWDKYSSIQGSVVAVLGDSHVAALQVNKDYRFTEILQDIFKNSGLPIYVLNAGVGGQDPVNYLATVKYFKKYIKPDYYIIVINNGDDFNPKSIDTINQYSYTRYKIKEMKAIKEVYPLTKWQIIKQDILSILRESWIIRSSFTGLISLKEASKKIVKNKVNNANDYDCIAIMNLYSPVITKNTMLVKLILKEINHELDNNWMLLQLANTKQLNTNTENESCQQDALEKNILKFANKEGIDLLQTLYTFKEYQAPLHWGHLNHSGHEVTANLLYQHLTRGYFKAQ